jgi:predicted metal-dependent enzyme (double-stranded beta helix superfamily)
MNVLLKDFINHLESLPDKPSSDMLKKYVVKIGGGSLPVEEYIGFSDQGYKRNVIHVSSKCEVVMICFQKGQYTPIHDHGGSQGITIIREGIMTEELFLKHQTGMISPTFTRRYHKGEISYINLTTIHRVSNVHTHGLVTMNIYFPPLTVMNLYNLEGNQVEKWVADYINRKNPTLHN